MPQNEFLISLSPAWSATSFLSKIPFGSLWDVWLVGAILYSWKYSRRAFSCGEQVQQLVVLKRERLPPELLHEIFMSLMAPLPPRHVIKRPCDECKTSVKASSLDMTSQRGRASCLYDIQRSHQPTMAVVSRVCKQWYDVVTPYLYKDIIVWSLPSLHALRWTLVRNVAARSLVRNVQYIPPVNYNQAAGSPNHVDAYVDPRPAIYRIIALCPNLKVHQIDMAPWKFRRILRDWVFMMFGVRTSRLSFLQQLDSRYASSVTQLELRYSRSSIGRLFSTDQPRAHFPLLTELRIYASILVAGGDHILQRPIGERIPIAGWPTMPELRRIRFVQCGFNVVSEVTVLLRIASSHAPSIRVVEFEGGMLATTNSFLATLYALAPDVELVTLVPNGYYATSIPANLDSLTMFKSLAHLRLSFSIFEIFSDRLSPNLRVLELYSNNRYQDYVCTVTCAVEKLLQTYARTCPDLEVINVYIIGSEQRDQFLELGRKYEGNGLKMNVHGIGTVETFTYCDYILTSLRHAVPVPHTQLWY